MYKIYSGEGKIPEQFRMYFKVNLQGQYLIRFRDIKIWKGLSDQANVLL